MPYYIYKTVNVYWFMTKFSLCKYLWGEIWQKTCIPTGGRNLQRQKLVKIFKHIIFQEKNLGCHS